MGDLVGIWKVALGDAVHRIEFDHGTISGKRVIRVDGKEIYRKDWMFRLVGKEAFEIGKHKCIITIEPVGGFYYGYTLEVDGKNFRKFVENQNKIMKTWHFSLGGTSYRVVLEKDTLDVWVNGQKMETTGEFVEDGTETHFEFDGHTAYIKAISSGNKREGLIHSLIVENSEMPEVRE